MPKKKKEESPKIAIPEKLSLLWIFLLFNYLYCDILGFLDPSVLSDVLSGGVGGLEFTPMFLLMAAIFMEIPIAMVLISRLVKRKWNRWAHFIAVPVMVAGQVGSLFVGEAAVYYAVYSVVEILTLLGIGWTAYRWR